MESLKNTFFLIVGLAIIGWSFYAFLQKPAPAYYQPRPEREFTISNSQFPINENSMKIENSKLKIGDKVISIEIADTPEEQSRGLSGREYLAPDSGLLFIFDQPAKYGFWMKDMNFPIDIVWIDENWKVMGVKRLVNPDTYPEVFYPPDNIKYVLEIGAGEAQKYGIDIGQFISYLQ